MKRYYLRSKGSTAFEGPFDVVQISELLRQRRSVEKIECLEAIGQSYSTLKRSTGWRSVREVVAAEADHAARQALNSGKPCRNCGSTESYTREVEFGGEARTALPVGFWSAAECRLCVCGGCGLAEWYLTPESLSRVKEKFARES